MHFSCPACNTLLKVTRVVPGSTATCPKCGTAVAVPAPPKGAPPVGVAVRVVPVARVVQPGNTEEQVEEAVPVLRASSPRKPAPRSPRVRDNGTRSLVIICAAVAAGVLGTAAVGLIVVVLSRGPARKSPEPDAVAAAE